MKTMFPVAVSQYITKMMAKEMNSQILQTDFKRSGACLTSMKFNVTILTFINVTIINVETAVNEIAPVSTFDISLTIHDRAVADPRTTRVKLERCINNSFICIYPIKYISGKRIIQRRSTMCQYVAPVSNIWMSFSVVRVLQSRSHITPSTRRPIIICRKCMPVAVK